MEILGVCATIFFARIVDVCMGTFRTVCIVKGKRLTSALIAFFEVLIWFVVAREALTTDYESLFIPIAYAAGYATGTWVGMILSKTFVKNSSFDNFNSFDSLITSS